MASKKYKKVILYADQEQYEEVRIVLLKKKQTVSSWFRDKLKEILDKEIGG